MTHWSRDIERLWTNHRAGIGLNWPMTSEHLVITGWLLPGDRSRGIICQSQYQEQRDLYLERRDNNTDILDITSYFTKCFLFLSISSSSQLGSCFIFIHLCVNTWVRCGVFSVARVRIEFSLNRIHNLKDNFTDCFRINWVQHYEIFYIYKWWTWKSYKNYQKPFFFLWMRFFSFCSIFILQKIETLLWYCEML